MIIVCRDASHAIRIACKDPLVRTGGFQTVHTNLFKKKGALLKRIDHSPKLMSVLTTCQKYVVDTEGHQGGDLTSIMANLSSAQQRWESMSAPARTYTCIMKAIGMLLGAMYDMEKDC